MLYYIIKLMGSIPFCMLYGLADALFVPFYYVVRYRRRIVRKNLTESFPDKSQREIVEIEKRFYHSFIYVALESCKLLTMSEEEMKHHMRFVNTEWVNALLSDGGSVAIYLGHFGNWEWITSLALWLRPEATKAQIYHTLRNKKMDRLMRQLRERMGHNVCVEMRDTVRFMVEAKQKGTPTIIGFIADQSPKRRVAKYFIPFLNHNTPVLTGTEKTIKHFDYTPVFLRVKRTQRGFYEAEFVPMLRADETDVKQVPDFELTNRYFAMLEAEITAHPELYLWTHNRFKYCK